MNKDFGAGLKSAAKWVGAVGDGLGVGALDFLQKDRSRVFPLLREALKAKSKARSGGKKILYHRQKRRKSPYKPLRKGRKSKKLTWREMNRGQKVASTQALYTRIVEGRILKRKKLRGFLKRKRSEKINKRAERWMASVRRANLQKRLAYRRKKVLAGGKLKRKQRRYKRKEFYMFDPTTRHPIPKNPSRHWRKKKDGNEMKGYQDALDFFQKDKARKGGRKEAFKKRYGRYETQAEYQKRMNRITGRNQ